MDRLRTCISPIYSDERPRVTYLTCSELFTKRSDASPKVSIADLTSFCSFVLLSIHARVTGQETLKRKQHGAVISDQHPLTVFTDCKIQLVKLVKADKRPYLCDDRYVERTEQELKYVWIIQQCLEKHQQVSNKQIIVYHRWHKLAAKKKVCVRSFAHMEVCMCTRVKKSD